MLFAGIDNFNAQVLVVDDDLASNLILADALQNFATVQTCESGEQALELVKSTVFDIILLDIEMPALNGFEVYKLLRQSELTQDSSIIFITSHQDTRFEYDSLLLGGIDFILKPFDIELCKLRVRNHINMKRQEAALRKARNDINQIVKHVPLYISYWSDDLVCQYCNDFQGKWFGLSADQTQGRVMSAVFPGELVSAIKDNLDSSEQHVFDVNIKRPINQIQHIQVGISLRAIDRDEPGIMVTLMDITASKNAKRALSEEKERLNIMLQSIGDAVIATDINANITFMNPIAEKMTGWLQRKAKGRHIEDVMDLRDAATHKKSLNPVAIAMREQRVVAMSLNCQLVSLSGETFRVEDSAAPIRNFNGDVTGGIIVFHDVSEAVAMSVKMSHLANYDQLTNLPNRILLHDRTEQALIRAKVTRRKVGLIFIDIDLFKFINDTLGHQNGDSIISLVAKRLESVIDESMTLSRVGGDEFAILMPDAFNSGEISALAKKAISAMTTPFFISEQEVVLSISIGISVSPSDASNVDQMMVHADTAMYRAKEQGRSRFCFFSEELEEKLNERRATEKLLRQAIETQTVVLHYQPKHTLETKQIIGAEALVRLKNKDGKLVFPDNFIPLAEETGLIIKLGELIIKQAFSDIERWYKMGYRFCTAINLSANQLVEPDFVRRVEAMLKQHAFPASMIEFEITESSLMQDFNVTKTVLTELTKLGIILSVDDFGTGYSNLSYLKFFPISLLKIDRTFVRDMLVDGQDLDIVNAIVQLGKSLKLELIAEGIEDITQLQTLIDLGCCTGQGYFFSKPIETTQFEQYLQLHAVNRAT